MFRGKSRDKAAMRCNAGAFSIAQEQGKWQAFTEAAVTKTLVLHKCLPRGEEGRLVERVQGKVSASAARAFGNAIRQARARAIPGLAVQLGSAILVRAADDDHLAVARYLEVAYAWGLADTDTVTSDIDTAYKVCGREWH
jgi:hypothetical protein